MSKLTYAQQLAHPLWQRRRLEMLGAAGWKCAQCEASEYPLHVHHKQYFKGRMAWEYADHELGVLCVYCHQGHHADEDHIKRLLTLVPAEIPVAFQMFSLLCGFYAEHPGVSDLQESSGAHLTLVALGKIARRMQWTSDEAVDLLSAHADALLAKRGDAP